MNIKNASVLFYLPEDANTDLLDYLISKDIYVIPVTDEEVLSAIDTEAYNIAVLYDYKNTPDDVTLITSIKRNDENCPIIVVSGQDNINNKLNAFRLGVNDYIIRPCNYEEFYLRVLSIIRLSSFSGMQLAKTAINKIRYYSIGKYILDTQRRKLTIGDMTFDLTHAERNLLLCLFNNKNKLVTKAELLKAIRNKSRDIEAAKRALSVVIHTLKRKLALDSNVSIEVVHREGYMLTASDNITNTNALAADLL